MTAMYNEYFGFSVKPFDLLPNPDFLFRSRSHRKAITYLEYGIQSHAGFICLTGEIGSGKTTLIRNLVREHGNSLALSKIFNTSLDGHQLLSMINSDFELPVADKSKTELLSDLYAYLIRQFSRKKPCVLIIDEAQNLSGEALEEVRQLSNLETDHYKLLQIILVGQPELRRTLSAPQLQQVRQRISVQCHLSPLSDDETKAYILHRLRVAGNPDAIKLHDDVVQTIHRFSGGTPRLINILMDYVLLTAYTNDERSIDMQTLEEIIADLDIHTPAPPTPRQSGPSQTVEPSRAEFSRNSLKSFLAKIQAHIECMEQEEQQKSSRQMQKLQETLDDLGGRLRAVEQKLDTMLPSRPDEPAETRSKFDRRPTVVRMAKDS
ncbi:XrtA/PEP-CTERM system-associated ATPase [Oceanidesulfovibrio marinus]|uniref:AAA family ATPase n=1 Tax=Oceanidesulfovibrio marinus TaxID=370038 RepID=A0ABX6NDT9_9BACT|nr:XrtA/PEP-CTERM system-associated ATPase [Oceanidesulfovibrio marinus]QJT07962.1 AAA family ATPase [Oceanidesulfovibrio marinus]